MLSKIKVNRYVFQNKKTWAAPLIGTVHKLYSFCFPFSEFNLLSLHHTKSDNKCVFGYSRTDGKQTLLTLFNFSDKEATIAPDLDGKITMLLNTD